MPKISLSVGAQLWDTTLSNSLKKPEPAKLGYSGFIDVLTAIMTQSSEPTRLDRIEAVVAANADAIAANARDIAELKETQRQQWAETRASIDDVVSMITTLAENTEQYRVQAEIDRRQAEIDRAEFRATVRAILDALTQRFSGNGHSE